MGSAQITSQPEKFAKFLFFAQFFRRRGLFNSHWPVDVLVAKPLCGLVLLAQCGAFVSQHPHVAQRPVIGVGPCDLPNHLDVFDLLQRGHDLWRVFKHVGLHGRGTHAAGLHRGSKLGDFFGYC